MCNLFTNNFLHELWVIQKFKEQCLILGSLFTSIIIVIQLYIHIHIIYAYIFKLFLFFHIVTLTSFSLGVYMSISTCLDLCNYYNIQDSSMYRRVSLPTLPSPTSNPYHWLALHHCSLSLEDCHITGITQ